MLLTEDRLRDYRKLATDPNNPGYLEISARNLVALIEAAEELQRLREQLPHRGFEVFGKTLVRAGVDRLELTSGWMRHVLQGHKARVVQLVRPTHWTGEAWAGDIAKALREMYESEPVSMDPSLLPKR